ncbi:endonuclease [Cloacibacillus sp.]|uniref:endonuclease n=1 Tax=Cloacibacillus sp. TaxID=2049023 RepID=UPI0025BD0400|nr:endonuclease [Cloacibacillus sp.]MCC8056607.1 endonuclease [Cloacibacillus sp.]MCC8178557.1 endonuclease [Cloacibacillus sp.]MCD8164327.1 endonuclease [Synergistaceae bacterium]
MIAGIDPGRWKIGVAFAEGDTLLFSAIIPADKRAVLAKAFERGEWRLLEEWRQEGGIKNIEGRRAEKICIGDGTSSREFAKEFPFEYSETDEYGTTLEARKIFWRLHPPGGIMKLIPLSLRTPPRNIDDLAAYAIILRAAGFSA